MFTLIKIWKQEAAEESVGNEGMLLMEWKQLEPLFTKKNEAMLESVGGLDAWNKLDIVEQARHQQASLQELKRQIGRDRWSHLPASVQHDLTFLVWAGCCMHKELNSVKAARRQWSSASIGARESRGKEKRPRREDGSE